MQYFGTDGVRGIVDVNLTPSIIKKIARAIVVYYKKHNLQKLIIVGQDGRNSGNYILSIFSSVLLRYGIEVHNLGVCSSPCLAYTTKQFSYPMGMMISASHNSAVYNGIKFFTNYGEKISEQTEQEIESYIKIKLKKPYKYAKLKDITHFQQHYINYLLKLKQNNLSCVFDCAYGGASKIVKLVFNKSRLINANPNGENINFNAGSTHPELLQKICATTSTIGFAFDGDADRILLISEKGEIISGDKILYILATNLLPKKSTVVGTIYSNEGLNKSLKQQHYNFVRAGVGDKLVSQKMKVLNSNLGGENSGHIIIKPYTNTGDGLLVAIIILNLLAQKNCSIYDLLKGYNSYFLLEENLQKTENFKLTNSAQNTIKELESMGARIIVRPSGTEPVIRLLAEHKEEKIAKKCLETLKNSLKT